MEKFFVFYEEASNCDENCNCDCYGDGCYCITD